MKKLNKDVFKTIFIILSIFTILGILIYNIQSYKKEYDNIYHHLNMMDEKRDNIHVPKELDNMIIMDYDIYTIKLRNNQIENIISHSSNSNDININEIVSNIINKEKNINIGNLYNNNYSYKYSDNSIIIIDTTKINSKLKLLLMDSLLILLVLEIIIYYISKLITKRITRPAQESFDKQKDFIADASHELKTPLAVIMASSDEITPNKENKQYLDNIKYESERMNNLIKSLLDLTKLEYDVSKDNYKLEDISKIVQKSCLTFEAIAFEQNIKIITNIKEDVSFKCNKDDIEKLIAIILDNAIKHSYKHKEIMVNLGCNKNIIEIEIINYGDPIKEEDKEKIFERFYRADKSRNRDSNRYGLGLAIAKNIVINHGGSIKAYSENGKTTFKIILKK